MTYYSNIQGWFEAHELYDFLIDQASPHQVNRFVEVGCWKGQSAAYLAQKILNSGKTIELVVVDTFKGSNEVVHHNEPELHQLFGVFAKNMNEWVRQGLKLTVHVGTLSSFANIAKLSAFDAIFLDASHDYLDVKQDVAAAKRLLKSGGWLCGDDYQWPGVARAVSETIGEVETGGKWKWWKVRV